MQVSITKRTRNLPGQAPKFTTNRSGKCHVKHQSQSIMEKSQAANTGSQQYRLETDSKDSGSSSTNLSASNSQENLLRYRDYETHSPRRRLRDRLTDIFIGITIALISISAVSQLYHHATFSPTTVLNNTLAYHFSDAARLNPKYHCGESATEARALGCIFDLSLVGWVPKPCFDTELNQRFMDWDWRFFEDQNGTIEVPLERIMESAGTREPFWAQHGYHITHCELAWQRMHKALRGEGRLTTHILNMEHTKHCGMMTEMRDNFYSLNSQILPLLNTC